MKGFIYHSAENGQMFTARGVANAIGITVEQVEDAVIQGAIKHDQTAWCGTYVVFLFYPASLAGIRAALRADQKTS